MILGNQQRYSHRNHGFQAFFDSLSKIALNVKSITRDIACGKGTIGKLVTDDEFYLDLSSIFTKANTMMNDINQYGILFQYSKAWQRQRVKLMAKSNAIKNPQAFEAQINQDVDALATTLERMNVLTNRFSTKDLSHNKKFQKQFLLFMNNLKALQQKVSLYNEELYQLREKNPEVKKNPCECINE